MPARRPTLEEWFLAYQLKRLARGHFYSKLDFRVDVTPLAQRYQERGTSVPLAAVLIKAVALAARDVPEVNVAYFPRLWGDRIVEFAERTVNIPVVLDERGKSH